MTDCQRIENAPYGRQLIWFVEGRCWMIATKTIVDATMEDVWLDDDGSGMCADFWTYTHVAPLPPDPPESADD